MYPKHLRTLATVLRRYGVPQEGWEADAEVSLRYLDEHKPIAPYQLISLVESAIKLSGQPRLGLEFGAQLKITALGPLGHGLLSCATLRDAVRLLMRYYTLEIPYAKFEFIEQSPLSIIRCQIKFEEIGNRFFGADTVLTSIHKSAEFLLSDHSLKGEVRFAYPEPEHKEMFEKTFGTDVVFDSPFHEIHFDHQLLDAGLSMADQTAVELYRQKCEALLQQHKHREGYAAKIRSLLLDEGVTLSEPEIAERFHMSDRSLRRRLSAENTGFQEILNEVRTTLAEQYLQTTSLPVADIGVLLGFNDSSNFRRAFIKWTGKTPAAYRREWYRS